MNVYYSKDTHNGTREKVSQKSSFQVGMDLKRASTQKSRNEKSQEPYPHYKMMLAPSLASNAIG